MKNQLVVVAPATEERSMLKKTPNVASLIGPEKVLSEPYVHYTFFGEI